MCFGSCFGAFQVATYTEFQINFIQSGQEELLSIKRALEQADVSLSHSSQTSNARFRNIHTCQFQALRWISGYALTFPIAFGFVIVSKLLVLDRFRTFAQFRDQSWNRAGRILVISIVSCTVCGFAGNIAAVVFFLQSSSLYIEFAATNVSSTSQRAQTERLRGIQAAAAMLSFEIIILILIIAAFLVVGFIGASSIKDAIKSLNIDDSHAESLKDMQRQVVKAGKQLRLRVLSTAGFVFVSFLLRLSYAAMFAISSVLSNSDVECPDFINRCSPCYNTYTYIQIWMLYNPEFLFAVTFISQNIVLLVALWGMTSGKVMTLLRQGNQGNQDDGITLSRDGSIAESPKESSNEMRSSVF